jgi:hypothetical protein
LCPWLSSLPESALADLERAIELSCGDKDEIPMPRDGPAKEAFAAYRDTIGADAARISAAFNKTE